MATDFTSQAVTAETGAAFQDIKKVIRSRSPFMNINLFNARVQGKGTETEIIDGIKYFNNHPELADVIIIGRGGGSLEDLWTRHVLDSLQLIPFLPQGRGHWLDLGSGGGFPAAQLFELLRYSPLLAPVAQQDRQNYRAHFWLLPAGTTLLPSP